MKTASLSLEVAGVGRGWSLKPLPKKRLWHRTLEVSWLSFAEGPWPTAESVLSVIHLANTLADCYRDLT